MRLASILALLTLLPTLAASPPDPEDPLRKAVEGLVRASGAKAAAVALIDLATGRELMLDADGVFHAASTMKVPVMVEVYRLAETGALSLDEKIPLKNEFASLVDGSPFTLDPKDDSELTLYQRIGQTETIRELVRLMITESSNFATNLLIARVGAARVDALMRDLDVPGVRVLRGVEDGKAYAKGLNNTVTARGLAKLLRLLAERKAVGPAASEAMLAVLRGQKFHEGIPAGLPPGTPVAHKTGWIEGRIYHDAAVVEPAGRSSYVLVVLTREVPDDTRAYRLAADIARVVEENLARTPR